MALLRDRDVAIAAGPDISLALLCGVPSPRRTALPAAWPLRGRGPPRSAEARNEEQHGCLRARRSQRRGVLACQHRPPRLERAARTSTPRSRPSKTRRHTVRFRASWHRWCPARNTTITVDNRFLCEGQDSRHSRPSPYKSRRLLEASFAAQLARLRRPYAGDASTSRTHVPAKTRPPAGHMMRPPSDKLSYIPGTLGVFKRWAPVPFRATAKLEASEAPNDKRLFHS